MKIHFTLNGTPTELEVQTDEMLLEVLRRDLKLRSVRATCGVGVCGACTALVDGRPISTCIFLAPLVEGREVTTVEGLGGDHPVQRAFDEEFAFQCGYCTPGMILTVKSFLEENPTPSDEEIKVALGGNLCRCGSYVKIIRAVKRVASTGLASSQSSQTQ